MIKLAASELLEISYEFSVKFFDNKFRKFGFEVNIFNIGDWGKMLPKMNRNSLCPCGSNKKFKRCCGQMQSAVSPVDLHGHSNLRFSLSDGIQYHRAGKLRAAQQIYRSILQNDKVNVDALHLLALIEHQSGNNEEAFELINKAIKRNPNIAMFYNNLGEICRGLKKLEQAQANFEKALNLQPNFPEAYRNLGMLAHERSDAPRAIDYLQKAIAQNPSYIDASLILGKVFHGQRNFDEALRVYEKALQYEPENAALLCQKGIALRALGKFSEAIVLYRNALLRQPKVTEFYNNLAIVYQDTSNFSDAAFCFRKILEFEPHNEHIRHQLNALEHVTADRAPAAYVKEVFDYYAEGFDQHLLTKLEYRVPALLGSLINSKINSPNSNIILDLGCGTGLMGEEIRHLKRHLIGVDLSPKMLEKARAKKIYDELKESDLIKYLADENIRIFDIIIAADVLNYLGNLDSVFQNSFRLLSKAGLFVFSLEAHPNLNCDFELDQTGRYKHSGTYIETLICKYRFTKEHFSVCTIRKQQGNSVEGYLVLLGKN